MVREVLSLENTREVIFCCVGPLTVSLVYLWCKDLVLMTSENIILNFFQSRFELGFADYVLLM